MNRAPGRGLLARGIGVSGRTSIFSHKNNKATLQGSTAATWALPRIGHRSNSICSRRSTGFGRESPCRLSRHLQHATKPAETRDCRALEDAFKNATAALSGKIGGIGAALSPRRVDVVVVRKRKVEVPRGRRVNERMWTEFNRRQRKVTFCPDVEAKLVPSKEECYPTARYKAACFFSKYHTDVEKKRIAPGGPDQAEWMVLLAETRQAPAEARKKQRPQPPTGQGEARLGSSGLEQSNEESTKGAEAGGEQGDGGGGGCAAGVVPETGTSGWRRAGPSMVGGIYTKTELCRAAKTLRSWAEKFYRVSWTSHDGGEDSRFDWVVRSPAGSQYDIV